MMRLLPIRISGGKMSSPAVQGQVGSPSSVPIPDPTTLTTEAIQRSANSQRDYVIGEVRIIHQRLDAIDKATELLNSQVTRVPTDVDKQVGNLRELHNEKFASIDLQFNERDHRSERESRDNKVAVDAAFAAQKEAAAEQNKSNTLAINKSEISTNQAILKLEQLVQAAINGLNDKISDVVERNNKNEQAIFGLLQAKAGGTSYQSTLFAIGSILIAIIAVVVSVYAITKK